MPPTPSSSLPAVEGRTHSVQVHYLEQPATDYLQAAVQAAVNIHREDLPGDILIFLTGQDECEAGEHAPLNLPPPSLTGLWGACVPPQRQARRAARRAASGCTT